MHCTLRGQALPAVTAVQSNVLHFGHEEEGVDRSWNAQENDYSLLECTAPLQGQAILAMNAGQSNVQRTRRLGRGISSAVVNEEAQLSPAVSAEPPERPTQTAGHAGDSMVRRVGLSVVRRSGPRRVADTPQLQALLEDLVDPSATISEGDGNNKEDTAATSVQHNGCLGRGISSAVVNEEAQLSLQSAQNLQRGPHRLQGTLGTQWFDKLDCMLCADQLQEGWLTHPSCKHCWRI